MVTAEALQPYIFSELVAALYSPQLYHLHGCLNAVKRFGRSMSKPIREFSSNCNCADFAI
jgi:hypothetical protein